MGRAKKNKKKAINDNSDDDSLYDRTEPVPDWARDELENQADDDFFLNGDKDSDNDGKNAKKLSSNPDLSDEEKSEPRPSTKEELDLLLAGENDEATRDYDIRGLMRIDKNKDENCEAKEN